MKRNRLSYSIAALGAAALASIAVVGGAGATAEQTTPDKNIVQTAAGAGQFKTLIALAKQAGLAGALSAPGKLTVFAPTDKAFAKVPKATLRKLAAQQGPAPRGAAVPRGEGRCKGGTGRQAAPRQDAERRVRPNRSEGQARLPQPHDARHEDGHRRLERHDPRHRRRAHPAGQLAGTPGRPAGSSRRRPDAPPLRLYHVGSAGVAQLVELRSCKAVVVGSSPTSGSRPGRYAGAATPGTRT